MAILKLKIKFPVDTLCRDNLLSLCTLKLSCVALQTLLFPVLAVEVLPLHLQIMTFVQTVQSDS